mmetsp:Transcript_12847/g.31177  ORF Transcript_12847/g.31177 Transcript_12847/m.31177 type:complete len:371 (+) Transcript_12847:656-1768(+)
MSFLPTRKTMELLPQHLLDQRDLRLIILSRQGLRQVSIVDVTVLLLTHRTVREVTSTHRPHLSVVNQVHLIRLHDVEIPRTLHLNGRTANTRTVLPSLRNHRSILNTTRAMCRTRRIPQRRVVHPITTREMVGLLHHRLILLTRTTEAMGHSRQGASMRDIIHHHRLIRTTMIVITAILRHTRTRDLLPRAIHRTLRPILPMGILPQGAMVVTTMGTHPTDLVLSTEDGTDHGRTTNMSGTTTRTITVTHLISTARTVPMTPTVTRTAAILATTTAGRRMTSPVCSSQQQQQRSTSMLRTLPRSRLCPHRLSLSVTVPLMSTATMSFADVVVERTLRLVTVGSESSCRSSSPSTCWHGGRKNPCWLVPSS